MPKAVESLIPKVTEHIANAIDNAPDLSAEMRWQQLGDLQPELARYAIVAACHAEEAGIATHDAFLRGVDFAIACITDQELSDRFVATMRVWEEANTDNPHQQLQLELTETTQAT